MKFPIALLGLASIVTPGWAQIDYRNLDRGRPSAVEDPYPVERYGFEVSGAYSGRGFGSGRSSHFVTPELMYGFAEGAHLALALPWAVSSPNHPKGLAGVELSTLVNLSTETVRLPGIALRIDGSLPAGSAGGSGAGISILGLATRSFGRQRIHLNAAAALTTPRDPGLREPVARWWLGLAVDRTLIRTSTLLIGEAVLSQEERGDPLVGGFGIGLRRQLTPALVLDAGVSSQLQRTREAQLSLTIGLSHGFGVAALMPGGVR